MVSSAVEVSMGKVIAGASDGGYNQLIESCANEFAKKACSCFPGDGSGVKSSQVK